ncbi:hypothetical protein N7456_006324 [Penicillium angulare]|uniref:Nephrocystin 3-like N-terminal domain-containing protein n=1 Tax=Penicillium angulare TaxID=116970 RepID=A0A9W9FHG6_9EURO|nr:hypothetical protein N7456_006324 [Penicillium angulare]
MEKELHYAGEYKSEGHQLIGNIFNGPVSFSAPDGRRGHFPLSNQIGVDPEDSGAVLDEFGDIRVSDQDGNLGWNDYAQSLAFKEYGARERLIGIQSPGTCEWLLKSPEYLRWNDKHGLFLIRGKPGCGKSTILKFLLDQRPEAVGPSSSIALSFFFLANGTELQSTILGFFRSLLLQLLEQDEQSRSIFMKACAKFATPGGKDNQQIKWQQIELEAHFQKLVIECSARRKISIFIDALDECIDKDRYNLIAFCHKLSGQTKEKINKPGILVTCRPYPDGQIKADFQIRLEENNQDDIQSFVDQNLRLPDEMPKDADDLRHNLLKKAGGLFLWLVLVIPQIHDMSSKGLSLRRISSEILQSPQELDGIYESLLSKIENSELLEAGVLFQWICFAVRPLSLTELRIAMTVHLSGSKCSIGEYENEENSHFISSDAQMKKRMVHLSRGLVDMANGKLSEHRTVVGFHHDTIRDFMLRKGLNYLDKRLNDPRGLAKVAHVHQANTCLLYLSTDEIKVSCAKEELFSAERFQFLGYATTYWKFHAIIAERGGMGEEVIWPTQALLDIWINTYRDLEHIGTNSAIKGTTLMHIAAEYGLEELAKRVMSTNKRPERPTPRNIKLSVRSISAPKVEGRKDTTEKRSGPAKASTVPPRIRQSALKAKKPRVAGGKPRSSPGEEKDGGKRSGKGCQEGGKMRFQGMGKGVKDLVNALNENGDAPLHLAAEHGSLSMVVLLYNSGSVVVQPNHSNCTPLYKASRSGHLGIVKFLYEHGAGPNIHQASSNDWTPLAVAAEQGHLEVLKFLLEKGADADIHVLAGDGQTPLYAACRNGHFEIVEFLFKNGADADIRKVIKNNQTPIYAASRNGHLEVVRFLCEKGADGDIYQATDNGWTPFAVASERGHLDVARFLYNISKRRPDLDIHHVTNDGQTPLYAACRNGHLEIVKFLFEKGADPKTQNVNKDGQTPLFTACRNGHLDVVKFLLDRGVDIHQATDQGFTPTLVACASGHLKVAKLLYDCGAGTDMNRSINIGLTPLLAASLMGHLDVVKFLCEVSADADIHKATDNGVTPFRAALEAGHFEVVKFLVDQGADCNAHQESDCTPFFVASERGNLDIVNFLYGKGADIHHVTKDGQTPFYAACRNGHLEVAKLLLKQGADTNIQQENGWSPIAVASERGYLDIVTFLYEKDVDIHSVTKNGQTPFLAACRSGHLEVVKFLIERGADIHQAMDHECTPLFAACANGHLEIVKLLLERGADADIHHATDQGWTSIHAASNDGHLEVIKYLSDHGSNLEAKDICGRTSLFLASARGRMEVVQQLLSYGADINTKDRYGSTPLSAPVRNGHDATFACLCVSLGGKILLEDSLGHSLLWWAKKSGKPMLVTAITKIAQISGHKICDTDLFVETSSVSSGESGRVCDVCTRSFSAGAAYQHCSICQGGNFDVCLECFEMGMGCLNESHELALNQPIQA